MKTIVRSLFAIALLLAGALALPMACGRGPGSAPPAATTDPAAVRAELAAAVANLERVRPGWDQLRAWAAGMTRLPLPAFRKALNVLPGKFGGRGYTVVSHVNYWAEVAATYPVNMSPAASAGPISPPWVDADGRLLTYPFAGPALDEKLRAIATVLLEQKARGLPVVFGLQVRITPELAFTDHAAFDDWVATRYLPMVIEMAAAAEIVKAEFLDPFPCEVEAFLNRFNQPRLDVGTPVLVAAANRWLDRTREAIRPSGAAPLFTGRLVGRSYANYEAGGYADGAGGQTADGSFWTGVRFAGYDELHFTISSNSSPTYIDTQLRNYQTVAGARPWAISEVWLSSRPFAANGAPAPHPEADYLTRLFATVDALTGNRPLGIGVDINPEDDAGTLDPAALAVVTAYFRAH